MKLKQILNEVSISNYDDFTKQLNAAVDGNDYNEFRNLIKSSFSKNKYEWFGMWYSTRDQDGKLTKQLIKTLNY